MAGRPLIAHLRARLAGPHQGLDRDLKVLNVGSGALVEDHEIHGQPLHPPVFGRLQRLPHEVDLLHVGNAHQHDREIAGYAQAPQIRLAAAAAANGVRWRPQHRSGVDDVPGQTLVLTRLASIDAEMVQLHLRLRPGERAGPLECADVVVLVDQAERGLA